MRWALGRWNPSIETRSTSREPSTAPITSASWSASTVLPAPSKPSTATAMRSPGRSATTRSARSRRTAYLTVAGTGVRTSADADAGGPGRLVVDGLAHLLGEAHGLLDERLDDLRLGHGLDDLALDEDLALAVAGGDAEIGLAGLARTVDDAAHDGHAQRHGHPLEACGHLVGERVDVDLGATARRARDDLELARSQVEALQDLDADLDLLDGRSRQGDADRVADPTREQGAEGRRRLDGALEGRAGLGDTEVQGPVAPLGEQLVGAHHDDGVVVLDRDLEVVEVVLLEEARLPDGRLDERLGRRLAVLLHDPLVEAAGVDADADGDTGVLGLARDLLDLVVELADVAGVDAHRCAAGLDGGVDVLRLEVDVGDDRDLALPRDRGQRVGVVLARAGDAHDVAAAGRELGDLLEGRVDVGRRGRRHRLDRDREVAADADLAHVDLTGLATRREDRRGQGRHTEGDAHPAIMTALGGSAPEHPRKNCAALGGSAPEHPCKNCAALGGSAPEHPRKLARQPKSLIGLTMSA